MNKKTIAIIAEIIPIFSTLASFTLLLSAYDSELVRLAISITMPLAFAGFIFFFAGRKLAKESKTARILGILDLLATVCVIGFYILAIFSFGL